MARENGFGSSSAFCWQLSLSNCGDATDLPPPPKGSIDRNDERRVAIEKDEERESEIMISLTSDGV